jgi:4'-phosphopantetheinyl transferase
LWRLSLSDFDGESSSGAELASGLRYLSADEQARYERATHPGYRSLFLAGRLMIRCLLSEYTGSNPMHWTIETPGAGKPMIPELAADFAFNLSHTDGFLVLLVARATSVGVDVERPARRVDPVKLGRPVFSSFEMAQMEALPEGARHHHFLRRWTMKESFTKALGMGIDANIRRISLDIVADPPLLVEWPDEWPELPKHFLFFRALLNEYLVAGTILSSTPDSDILVQDAAPVLREYL